jgi:pimeloyl-ACP methyl ester carboxylesterase
MLHHAGSGRPTVVFEAGAGGFGLDYFNLFALVARRTAAVLYDRAGRGWSDPVAGKRGAAEIVTDLRAGLRAAGLDGPFVLVGHSLGGLLVRAFAQRFPDEVVGLVLIDPAAEGMPMATEDDGSEGIVREMIAQARANPALWREWYPDLFADWEKLPEQIREPLIARHMEPPYDEAGLHDMMSGAHLLDEVANGPAVPDVPVIVLTGMRVDQTPGRSDAEMAAFNQIKLDAHRNLLKAMPRAEHRVFDDVGHRLTAERPDLVVDAIFDILARCAAGQRQ